LQELAWLFADRVVSVPKADRNYYPEFPYEVVQTHELKHYPPPPFSANQKLCAAMGRVLEPRLREESPSPYELGRREMREIFESLE